MLTYPSRDTFKGLYFNKGTCNDDNGAMFKFVNDFLDGIKFDVELKNKISERNKGVRKRTAAKRFRIISSPSPTNKGTKFGGTANAICKKT